MILDASGCVVRFGALPIKKYIINVPTFIYDDVKLAAYHDSTYRVCRWNGPVIEAYNQAT